MFRKTGNLSDDSNFVPKLYARSPNQTWLRADRECDNSSRYRGVPVQIMKLCKVIVSCIVKNNNIIRYLYDIVVCAPL